MNEPSDSDLLERLNALLETVRPELHALPGVIATGVGVAPGHAEAREVEIQVFVGSPGARDEIEPRLAGMLGEAPFRIILTGEVRPGDGTESALRTS